MVDIIKLSPESFRTIYLKAENNVILKTESGRRIIIQKIIPEEWKPYRLYDYELAINDNRKEISLVDNRFLSQINAELEKTLRTDD